MFFELFFRVGFLVVTWSFIVQFVPRGIVDGHLGIWAYRLGREPALGCGPEVLLREPAALRRGWAGLASQ